MSVMVKKLYKSGDFLYKMQMVAGKKGLNNVVKWVHILEDSDVISFLHGNEMVFTTGILNRSEDWMLRYAQKLHEVGASAFVVNIGPYTSRIPQEVVDYCDKVSLPLFSIPWKTKVVDMTRDFCHQIIRNEQREDTVAMTLKNIIFQVGDPDTQVLQMERYGYPRNVAVTLVCVNIGGDRALAEQKSGRLVLIAERAAKDISERFARFGYNENQIFALFDYQEKDVKQFIHAFLESVRYELPSAELHIGVSPNQEGLYHQNVNFDRGLSTMEMARRHGEAILYYDELGIYKLLYALGDKSVLKEFYEETAGKLEKYDRDNHTELFQLLRAYLENNGSLKLVSEKLFVHRNTVTNQLKKIEQITGCDPLLLEDKLKLLLGLYIKNML